MMRAIISCPTVPLVMLGVVAGALGVIIVKGAIQPGRARPPQSIAASVSVPAPPPVEQFAPLPSDRRFGPFSLPGDLARPTVPLPRPREPRERKTRTEIITPLYETR